MLEILFKKISLLLKNYINVFSFDFKKKQEVLQQSLLNLANKTSFENLKFSENYEKLLLIYCNIIFILKTQ